jgi:hypothetical protein
MFNRRCGSSAVKPAWLLCVIGMALSLQPRIWAQQQSTTQYSSLPIIYIRTASNTSKGTPPTTEAEKKQQATKEAAIKQNNFALNLPAATLAQPPACATPPTPEQLKAFGHFKGMTVKDAANLNLTFGGIQGQFSDNSQVVIYRSGKTFTCPSTDGKYLVTYGTEVDGGVAISQISLNGSATFAVIAANAQISNASTSYDYAAVGYTDTSAWDTANSKVIQDMANNLTVPTYDAFSKDWTAALATVPNLSKPATPAVIGYAPIGVAGLAQSLADGYALMFIAEGRGCMDATNAFPVKDSWVDGEIRKVYLQLSNGKSDCSGTADPTEGPIARQLLAGVKIANP